MFILSFHAWIHVIDFILYRVFHLIIEHYIIDK